MSCPICGPICHCDQQSKVEQYEPIKEPVSRFPDPDAYDASEQQFAASLEQNSPAGHNAESVEAQIEALASDLGGHVSPENHDEPVGWKQELAAKLDDYRSRHKPKPPRYPSLQLKFETEDPAWSEPSPQPTPPAYATRESNALDHAELAPAPQPEVPRSAETTGRLIEFPRSANVPTAWVDALADPVMERPRILEVPESDFLPPALGGISIEPVPAVEDEKRPGIEIPMLTAPMSRRVAAGALDGAIVAAGVALSGCIFVFMTGTIPALRPLIEGGVLVTACLWAAYHYLLIVYSGTTPGLKVAGLELSSFDGKAVPRKLRRWRVLASVLSGVSLCLGYAWCYLDEDRLCWHDRITKTYMAPKP
jgi:uncharacterized RDD family membrane protein YckC